MSVDLALFNSDGSLRPWEEVARGIQTAVSDQRSGLRLVGPEPTRSPDLLRAVAACRSAGLEVQLETDAAALAGEGRAQILLNAGLSGIHVRLWGCSPVTHDARAGAGSFKRSLRGVRAARQGGLAVELAFALNRSNASELSRAVELADSLDARSITVERDASVGLPAAPQLADALTKAVKASLKHGVSLQQRADVARLPQISGYTAWELHHHTFDSAVLALLEGGLVERPRTPLLCSRAPGRDRRLFGPSSGGRRCAPALSHARGLRGATDRFAALPWRGLLKTPGRRRR